MKRLIKAFFGLEEQITFYLGAVNFIGYIERLGGKWCFPEITQEPALEIKGVYSPVLANILNETGSIILNNISMEKDIIFVTGANQGGKTTFLTSIGLVQWLAQTGFPVCAEYAKVGICNKIATLFCQNDDIYSKTGRMEQEMGYIRELLNSIDSDNVFVLLNEPLSGTTEVESNIICSELLLALKASDCRGIWVTHLHKLAASADDMNKISEGSTIKNMVVLSENDNSSLSYKVIPGEPVGKSRAYDVLQRYGIFN